MNESAFVGGLQDASACAGVLFWPRGCFTHAESNKRQKSAIIGKLMQRDRTREAPGGFAPLSRVKDGAGCNQRLTEADNAGA